MAEYTREQVGELYISYYDRAADATGLDFWMTQTDITTIEGIAASFADQAETAAKYPDTMSTAEYVNTIYNNVFNRDADPDGLTYWVNALDDGAVTRGEMIVAIVNGAQGDDQKTIDNKVAVALDYADNGLNDYDNAVNIMDTITADEATVTDAQAQIEIWAQDVSTYDMLTTKDDYSGTDGDDIVKGITTGTGATTYQGIDIIDGGDGNDTLKIEELDNLAAAKITNRATVSNFETLDIVDSHTGAFSFGFDMTNVDGFDTVKFSGVSQGVAVAAGGGNTDTMVGTGAAAAAATSVIDNVEIAKEFTSSAGVNYTAGAVSGPTDSMDITMSSAAGTVQTFQTTGIENMDVHMGTGNLILDNAGLATMTVDGSTAITLNSLSAATTATKIDASVATGAVSILAGNTLFSAAATTYIGGSGVDTIVGLAGNDTISGNVGNDNLNGGGGTNTIDGGEGADSMTSAGAVDHFIFENEGDSGATVQTADRIAGFTKGTDTLDWDTLAAGVGIGTMTTDGVAAGIVAGDTFVINTTTVADYAQALAAANHALAYSATTKYSFQSDGTDGYLFIDGDGDGAADQSIILTGLASSTSLAAGDIIA